jgi:thiaminase/transcriptional activator TenA
MGATGLDFFERLRAAAAPDWSRYVEHPFVRSLAAGTLSNTAFQTYLVQDYLFLIQFARAHALAIYKGRSLSDMRAAHSTLSAILDVEMDLHVRLSSQWGLSSGDLEAALEHSATIAYTRFVLDCGMSGDLLDLHVALAPCVVGYAEIASRIAPQVASISDHPYRDWVAEYAGAPYQAVAHAARDQLARLADRTASQRRFAELSEIFNKASRLEAYFWQMALDSG